MMPPRTFAPFTRRDFLKHTAAFATAGGILLPQLRAQDTKFVTAETVYGKIRGVDNNGIKVFKGIPYGASTAGANRFMAPVEPAKWTGVRDALAYGHSAPQRDPSAAPRAAGGLTISGEGLPAEEVGRVIAGAIISKRPRTRYTVGRDAAIGVRLARFVSDRMLDSMLARALKPYLAKARQTQ